MKKIEEIDKNFIVKDSCSKNNIKVYNVCEAPFSIHGIIPPTKEGEVFCRLPKNIAESVSEGVSILSTHCAGGRVRFKTDSSYIAVKAVMGSLGKMPHFALTGSAGFDLYSGTEHITTFQPKFDITEELFGEYTSGKKELREYTLNFPLYSEVKEVYVIVDGDAVIKAPDNYKNEKPVVFYGSSITQGGCASRPGNSYSEMISRKLDIDYINLGFSGSAKGEKEIAEYIAKLDMSAFVFDYDHNAPTAEHLRDTHESFFKTVRKSHPDIPVICITQPFPCLPNYQERKEIIESTVINAKNNGDNNVYFIDMVEFMKENDILDMGTVDKCHPNDLGFYFMAKAVEAVIGRVL